MVNYAVSDMITRIRNGIRGKKARVSISKTHLTWALAQILLREGFIQEIVSADGLENEERQASFDSASVGLNRNSDTKRKSAESRFDILLAYNRRGPQTRSVLTSIKCVSRPGVRIYSNSRRIPQVLGGLGQSILSTSKGILTDTQARKLGIGGEVLCLVW